MCAKRRQQAASFIDEVPPVFANRTMAFRAFDADGMLRNAALAGPGEADAAIRNLFDAPEIAYIDAHNAALAALPRGWSATDDRS